MEWTLALLEKTSETTQRRDSEEAMKPTQNPKKNEDMFQKHPFTRPNCSDTRVRPRTAAGRLGPREHRSFSLCSSTLEVNTSGDPSEGDDGDESKEVQHVVPPTKGIVQKLWPICGVPGSWKSLVSMLACWARFMDWPHPASPGPEAEESKSDVGDGDGDTTRTAAPNSHSILGPLGFNTATSSTGNGQGYQKHGKTTAGGCVRRLNEKEPMTSQTVADPTPHTTPTTQ